MNLDEKYAVLAVLSISLKLGLLTKQRKYHMVTIEDLVPAEHFLQEVEAAPDLSFAHGEVPRLYSRWRDRWIKLTIHSLICFNITSCGFSRCLTPLRVSLPCHGRSVDCLCGHGAASFPDNKKSAPFGTPLTRGGG